MSASTALTTALRVGANRGRGSEQAVAICGPDAALEKVVLSRSGDRRAGRPPPAVGRLRSLAAQSRRAPILLVPGARTGLLFWGLPSWLMARQGRRITCTRWPAGGARAAAARRRLAGGLAGSSRTAPSTVCGRRHQRGLRRSARADRNGEGLHWSPSVRSPTWEAGFEGRPGAAPPAPPGVLELGLSWISDRGGRRHAERRVRWHHRDLGADRRGYWAAVGWTERARGGGGG